MKNFYVRYTVYSAFLMCVPIMADYKEIKTVSEFDHAITQKPYTVVAFYHSIEGHPLFGDEEQKIDQFRILYDQISRDPAYSKVQFIAVKVAEANSEGATIKQRYDVVGSPAYIIMQNGRQISPGKLKIGQGYITDGVTIERLKQFIDNTIE